MAGDDGRDREAAAGRPPRHDPVADLKAAFTELLVARDLWLDAGGDAGRAPAARIDAAFARWRRELAAVGERLARAAAIDAAGDDLRRAALRLARTAEWSPIARSVRGRGADGRSPLSGDVIRAVAEVRGAATAYEAAETEG